MRGQEFGTPFSQTATHATSAVATQAAVAGKKHYVTDYSGSSDKAGALILIKSGSTVIWQDIIGTVPYGRTFSEPLVCVEGDALTITVDGTSICKSNIAGYTL